MVMPPDLFDMYSLVHSRRAIKRVFLMWHSILWGIGDGTSRMIALIFVVKQPCVGHRRVY